MTSFVDLLIRGVYLQSHRKYCVFYFEYKQFMVGTNDVQRPTEPRVPKRCKPYCINRLPTAVLHAANNPSIKLQYILTEDSPVRASFIHAPNLINRVFITWSLVGCTDLEHDVPHVSILARFEHAVAGHAITVHSQRGLLMRYTGPQQQYRQIITARRRQVNLKVIHDRARGRSRY